ncbi:hypothetical protein D3C80_1941180 [compost metagenome]
MGGLHGDDQVLFGGHGLAQSIEGHRAGDFATLVAAHAVGHGPEPQFRGAQQRIFVVFTHASDDGLRGVSQELGHGVPTTVQR